MLLLMLLALTRLATSQELLLLIVKMVPEDISVQVEQVNIIRVLAQLLQSIKQLDVLLIKSFVLK